MKKKLIGSAYWEVIAEIDFLHYELEQLMKKAQKPRSGIEIMVDKATGYEEKQFDSVKTIVARIKELQALLPDDDPHFVKADTPVTTAASPDSGTTTKAEKNANNPS